MNDNAAWRQALSSLPILRRFRFLNMMVDEIIAPAKMFGGEEGTAILMWVRAGCATYPFAQVGRQALHCPLVQVPYPMLSKFGFMLAQALVMRAFAHHYGLVAGERLVRY